jgi:hypothetical protein
MTDCLWCGEPVLDTDKQEPTTLIRAEGPPCVAVRHFECAARVVVGSVGHQLELCACHGGPGTLDDPIGLSQRDAARMALAVSNALCKYAEAGPAMLADARRALQFVALELERRGAWDPSRTLPRVGP